MSRSEHKPRARRQGSLHVGPLSAVPALVARCGASHLMTCLPEDMHVETPAAINPDRHLRLFMHDIAQPVDGCTPPSQDHIVRLIEFAQAWGGHGPMVVHCWAGISRSTAAAFISLCALNPATSEMLIAQSLRAASPTAWPNRLMIRLADDALCRSGRMVDAIVRIGEGRLTGEVLPFSLPADFAQSS